MGAEVGSTDEKTWLEVIRLAAVSSEEEEAVRHGPFCVPIEGRWVTKNEEKADATEVATEVHELVTRDATVMQREDQLVLLVAKLKDCVEQPEGSRSKYFTAALKPYLQLVATELGNSEPALLSGTDEVVLLGLLKQTGAYLGQTLVGAILRCCLHLKFWSPVKVLLQSDLVLRNSCSKLVQCFAQEEQAPMLCLCIKHVPDLLPQDLFVILTFFLDSIDKPSRSFGLVRQEWREAALAAISKISSRRGPSSETKPSSRKIRKADKGYISAGVGLAMAVDRFSGPELCIHTVVAGGQDETLLSSVISDLNTSQVLRLLEYLRKWMDIYSSHLAYCPSPKIRRVPSMNQVLHWTGLVLEGHFMKLVLSSTLHNELVCIQQMVQALVAIGARISPLTGISEHIKSKSLLPVVQKHDKAAADYIIELLDIS